MCFGLELGLILLGTLLWVLLCAVEVIYYKLSLLQEVTSDRQSLVEKLKTSGDRQSHLEQRGRNLEESLTAATSENHSLEAALKKIDAVGEYLFKVMCAYR